MSEVDNFRDHTHLPVSPNGRWVVCANPSDPAGRRPLLHEAADALWAYVVQREAMGLNNHELLDQLYGVTPELWRLMGSAEVATRGQ